MRHNTINLLFLLQSQHIESITAREMALKWQTKCESSLSQLNSEAQMESSDDHNTDIYVSGARIGDTEDNNNGFGGTLDDEWLSVRHIRPDIRDSESESCAEISDPNTAPTTTIKSEVDTKTETFDFDLDNLDNIFDAQLDEEGQKKLDEEAEKLRQRFARTPSPVDGYDSDLEPKPIATDKRSETQLSTECRPPSQSNTSPELLANNCATNESSLQSTAEGLDLGEILCHLGITHQQFPDTNEQSVVTEVTPMEVVVPSTSGPINVRNKRGRKSLKEHGLTDEEIIKRRREQNALSQQRCRLLKKNGNRGIDDTTVAETTTKTIVLTTNASQEVDISSDLFSHDVSTEPMHIRSDATLPSDREPMPVGFPLGLPSSQSQRFIMMNEAQKTAFTTMIDYCLVNKDDGNLIEPHLRWLKTMADQMPAVPMIR